MKIPYIRPLFFPLWGGLLTMAFAPVHGLMGQQVGTIRGSVESSITSEVLVGVKVTLQGSTLQVQTGEGGQFVLEGVPSGSAHLRLEFPPDYVDSVEEVPVRPGVTTRVSMEMIPVAVMLDELMVRGKPASSDAAVRSFAPGEAREFVAGGTAVDLLTHSFPGIQVIRGSGDPGARSRLLIRGINSLTAPGDPVVFMDGVRLSDFSAEGVSEGRDALGILDMISADMVARIEVLKGPAATRFGVGSSNGVILIFTR